MSMTPSRQRVFWARRDAEEKAWQEANRPQLEYQETYKVTLEIKRQIMALNGTGYVPHIIWLGKKHLDRWIWEMKTATQGAIVPMDFDGFPVRHKACPGVYVMPRISDKWVQYMAEYEGKRHGGGRRP